MSSTSARDVLIVGGGPAGLATAIFAALAGFDVALFERRTFPVDKACGEGIMPGGVALLDRMGARLRASHPFVGIRYVDGDREVEARFRSGPGLGVRRIELSRALADRARDLGVTMVERTRALGSEPAPAGVRLRTDQGVFDAKWLVAADGLRSPLRRAAGLEGRSLLRRTDRYGARRHFRLPPWSSFVEVHWADGGEAYVTPVHHDEIGVALLWHGRAASFDSLLRLFPRLSRRLAGAEVVSRTAGAGPFRQVARRVTRGPIALVGDAAGYVDALTGEGVQLGFRSADALVRSLRGGDLSSYEKEYWSLSRRYRLMTELVLGLAELPRLRKVIVGALAHRPTLFGRLLHLNHRQMS